MQKILRKKCLRENVKDQLPNHLLKGLLNPPGITPSKEGGCIITFSFFGFNLQTVLFKKK